MSAFGNKVIVANNVILRPVLCSDGFYRWCVISFEDVDADTPFYISSKDLEQFETATDKSENPEYYKKG